MGSYSIQEILCKRLRGIWIRPFSLLQRVSCIGSHKLLTVFITGYMITAIRHAFNWMIIWTIIIVNLMRIHLVHVIIVLLGSVHKVRTH